MTLTTIGTGTFFVNETISASSFVLDTGKNKILIDCGPGTLVKLAQAGISIAEIDYVFITHFHPDHTSDLFPLFMNYCLTDRLASGTFTKFPTFVGPEGLDKFLSDYSHLCELHAYDGWKKINIMEYKPTMKFESFQIKSFKVTHAPFNLQARAYAIRFEVNGKIIAFSGDSAICLGVQKVCKNADLFVCDTSFPKTFTGNIHLTSTEIGQISEKGKVKKLLTDHFYPFYDQDAIHADIKEYYKGEIVKAKDLEILEI